MNIQQSLQIAIQHHQAGRLQQAEAVYRKLLEQYPSQPDALHFLGVIAYQAGRLESAVEMIRRAVTLRPNYADAFSNLGNALKDMGQLDDAIAAFRRAVELAPTMAEAHNNLGISLRDQGRSDEAISAFAQAIKLRPNYPKAISNLGVAMQDKGQIDNAISAYRQAIACKADYVEAYANLGNALKLKGDFDGALVACRQAVAIKPDYPEAWNYLGIVLNETGSLDESIAAFRNAILVRPGFVQAHSNLLFALNYHPSIDARTIKEESDNWNQIHAERMKNYIRPHTNVSNPDRRLRIGYVSSDLNAHPVGKFLLPLLAGHDRRQFEIFAYAQVRMEDEITDRLRACTDAWRNITGLSDIHAADLIRRDGIDILIDLAGHTARHRLLLFACKPAPVQVSFLGYPATTGLSTIDCRLTDPLADPPGMTDSHFTEQLIKLPSTAWCYQPPSENPGISMLPALQNNYVTFGSLNNFSKVNKPLLLSWAALLRRVPNSRLLLKAGALSSESARQRVLGIMSEFGIDAARLQLYGSVPIAEHLPFYHRIDIALDTHPYHGTTTTCEALWMGVPVVTRAGVSHVSRVGVSLLSAVGLPELIAGDADGYVQIAANLAGSLNQLSELRFSMRGRMQQSALMDAPAFARNVEAAYRLMWRQWCVRSSRP